MRRKRREGRAIAAEAGNSWFKRCIEKVELVYHYNILNRLFHSVM